MRKVWEWIREDPVPPALAMVALLCAWSVVMDWLPL
jgi:hypothetical protein